jgi:purine-cytosine permease-like protein
MAKSKGIRFLLAKPIMWLISIIVCGLIFLSAAYLTYNTFMANKDQIFSDFGAIGKADFFYYESEEKAPETEEVPGEEQAPESSDPVTE